MFLVLYLLFVSIFFLLGIIIGNKYQQLFSSITNNPKEKKQPLKNTYSNQLEKYIEKNLKFQYDHIFHLPSNNLINLLCVNFKSKIDMLIFLEENKNLSIEQERISKLVKSNKVNLKVLVIK